MSSRYQTRFVFHAARLRANLLTESHTSQMSERAVGHVPDYSILLWCAQTCYNCILMAFNKLNLYLRLNKLCFGK